MSSSTRVLSVTLVFSYLLPTFLLSIPFAWGTGEDEHPVVQQIQLQNNAAKLLEQSKKAGDEAARQDLLKRLHVLKNEPEKAEEAKKKAADLRIKEKELKGWATDHARAAQEISADSTREKDKNRALDRSLQTLREAEYQKGLALKKAEAAKAPQSSSEPKKKPFLKRFFRKKEPTTNPQ